MRLLTIKVAKMRMFMKQKDETWCLIAVTFQNEALVIPDFKLVLNKRFQK